MHFVHTDHAAMRVTATTTAHVEVLPVRQGQPGPQMKCLFCHCLCAYCVLF